MTVNMLQYTTMGPSLALRKACSTRRLHLIFRHCSFACSPHRPSVTGYVKIGPSKRYPAFSSACYGTSNRMRSYPVRDPAAGVQACDTDVVRPNEYTAGRWLKQDKLQRDARHLDFDFAALTAKAIALCPKARSVSACTKLESGFNKAFLYTMDSGERIVARVPTPIAGPRRLTTNSEVATIAYSKRVL
jgi:hypothetical protein